jgi:sugar/nucleoside kinase (ribokinase family)
MGLPVSSFAKVGDDFVADTTGAGDCWDAGFVARLAGAEDIPTAVRMGNACSAFCIEAWGGINRRPPLPGGGATSSLMQRRF